MISGISTVKNFDRFLNKEHISSDDLEVVTRLSKNVFTHIQQNDIKGDATKIRSFIKKLKSIGVESEALTKLVDRIETVFHRKTLNSRVFRLVRTLYALDIQGDAFKACVRELRELISQDLETFSDLNSVLGILVNDALLKCSGQEWIALQELLRHFNIRDENLLKKYDSGVVYQDFRKIVLEFLHKATNCDELLDRAKKIKKKSLNQLIKLRYQNLSNEHEILQRFTLFPKLVVQFKEYMKLEELIITDQWGEFLKFYDQQTGGKFSLFVKEHEFLDPIVDITLVLEISKNKFFERSDCFTDEGVHVIPKGPAADIWINTLIEPLESMYAWVKNHVQWVRISFNQGGPKRESEIVGGGVCYSNSLQRYSAFLNDPQRGIQEMEITPHVRFAQANYQAEMRDLIQQARNQTVSKEKSQKIIDKLAHYHGLHILDRYEIKNGSLKTISSYIQHLQSQGFSQALLKFSLKGDGAHAMNVIFDLDNEHFIIVDDNCGVVEYKTLRDLILGCREYLHAFYPTIDCAWIETFQKL